MRILRKLILVMLTLSLFMSLVILPAQAAPAPGDCSHTDAENIEFITGPEFNTLDLNCLEKFDGVSYSIKEGETYNYGYIDLDGNVLFGGKSGRILSEKYIYYKPDDISPGSVYTTDGKRVTQDLYTNVEEFYWGVWAFTRQDKTVDYYTQDMEQIRLPKLPSGWEVDKVISPYLFVGGYQAQPNSRDQKLFLSDGSELKYPDNFSKVFRVNNINILDSKTLCGTVHAKGGGGSYVFNEKGEVIRSLPDETGLYRTDWDGVYLHRGHNLEGLHIVDRDGNVLISMADQGIIDYVNQFYHEERAFIVYKEEPITLWGNDDYVVEYNGYMSVYDLTGKNLTPGWYDSVDSPTGRVLLSLGCTHRIYLAKPSVNEYIAFNELGEEIAHIQNSTKFSLSDGIIVIVPEQGPKQVLDWTGKRLAEVDRARCGVLSGGFLFVSDEESGESLLLADTNGNILSDQVYSGFKKTGIMGLVNAQRKNKWYLVNSKGEELNESGFDTPVVFGVENSFSSIYGTYKMNGKVGLIRYKEPGEGPFRDVKPSAYYNVPVAWAVEHKITNGTDKFHFSPNEPCTRAQVVTFLWRANGSPEPKRTENPFTDVKTTDYFYKAVLWAVEQKITNGMDETHFAPSEPCTRAQVVTFQWRANGCNAPTERENPFADVSDGRWYSDAILWAVERKITKGTDKTHFSPDETCTRAQVVTFLYRDLAE